MRWLIVPLVIACTSPVRAQPDLAFAPPDSVPPALDAPRPPTAPPGLKLLLEVRSVNTPAPAVWATGLALFLTAYFAGGIASTATYGQLYGLPAWFPITGVGALVLFSSNTGRVLLTIDSVAQAAGFATFLAGLAAGPKKLVAIRCHIVPTGFVGGGSGLAITLPF